MPAGLGGIAGAALGGVVTAAFAAGRIEAPQLGFHRLDGRFDYAPCPCAQHVTRQ